MKGRASVLVKPNQLETWDVEIADPEPGGALRIDRSRRRLWQRRPYPDGRGRRDALPHHPGTRGNRPGSRTWDRALRSYAGVSRSRPGIWSTGRPSRCAMAAIPARCSTKPLARTRNSSKMPESRTGAATPNMPGCRTACPSTSCRNTRRPEAVAALGCALPTVLRGSTVRPRADRRYGGGAGSRPRRPVGGVCRRSGRGAPDHRDRWITGPA